MTAEKIKPYHLTRKKPPTQKQADIIHLKKQNPRATATAIAKLAGADISYTIQVMQRYGLIAQNVNDYKQHRADILAGLQNRLLESITPEDIQKAPVGSRVLAVAQLYDKERLERNQSTANISTAHGITPEMQELYDKITGRAKVEGQVIEVKPEAQITE
jgi:hypothetical protein